MITLLKSDLDLLEKTNPEYVAWFKARATETAPGFLTVSAVDALLTKRDLEAPPISEQIKNLHEELRRWQEAGRPVVSKVDLLERYSICKGCEFHNPSRILVLARCMKCGCSGLKLHMATTKCPDGNWGSLTENPPEGSLTENPPEGSLTENPPNSSAG